MTFIIWFLIVACVVAVGGFEWMYWAMMEGEQRYDYKPSKEKSKQ